jgi:filamentous hemagglutinin family protein
MNHIYRVRWNYARSQWVVTSELTRRATRGGGRRRRTAVHRAGIAIARYCAPLLLSVAAWAGGPTGGQVVAGAGQILQSGSTTTVRQTTQTLSINWQSFDIGTQQTVNFVQPGASSIAVNRILGATATEIFGHLNANGQVWLINPNGVLFGKSAQVSVGGLVASTLDLVDDGSTDIHRFRGEGKGAIINQGTITAADGGYVALMGHQVSNQGIISARLGTVALGAGRAQTLTFSGNRLLHLQVDESTLDDLVENHQLIQADGGQVVMTAGAKNSVLASVVNNTGIIQAETVENHNGTITLLGSGAGSTVNAGGRLDAGATHGGNGGFIETSAAHVTIAGDAKIDASAPAGRAGTWLVDPTDLTIDATAASTISSSLQSGTNVTEQTTASGASGQGQQSAGQGDINVNAPITWTNSAGSLTLSAYHAINVNAAISGTGQLVMDAAGGNLTLNSGGTVTGSGGVTLRTGRNFVNNAGASSVRAGTGTRWLVYSTNPTLDTAGGLIPAFVQYNAPYGTTPTPTAGSGFLYSLAPTLTVTGLSGSVNKTYDGTTVADLTGTNLTASGLVNGDKIASASGSYSSPDAGSGLSVTSPTSASALTIQTSAGTPVYGYGLSGATVTQAIGTISPAVLSASIAGNPTKVYDGTTTATLSSTNYAFTGFVSGQGASVDQPSSVAYDSTEAGSRTINATFTSTNFKANSGTNLSNYVLPATASGAGTITQAPVNLTGLLANDKTYDGTTNATLNTSHAGLFGVITPDAGSVSLDTSGAYGTFASANAGNRGIAPAGFTLTGAKAADYQLIAPSNLTANILPKTVTVAGVAATDKVYDATTGDLLSLGSAQLSGVIGSDTGHVLLNTGSAAGTFASANAGSNIGVSVGGLTLFGSAAANYSIVQPTGLAASITPAPLNIVLSGNPTKPYNGTTTAAVRGSDFTITGFVGGESATVAQASLAEYASPNAGNHIGVTATLEPSDFSTASGTLLSNYSFPHTVAGFGTINPITLTGYITNNPTKTYDGTTAGTVRSADYVLTGFINSESATINQTSATYAAATAGPETITASLSAANFVAGSGTLLSNYVLPTALSGSGTIQPALLSGKYINGSIVGNPTKIYDGTTTATLTSSNFQLTGFVGSDSATVNQTVGQYANANVGIQNVTAHLTGGDFSPGTGTNLSNYVLPTIVYGTGTINPATLTAIIVGDPTKVYNGTTTAVLTSANYHLSGFAPGEGASIDPSSLINYSSKNVGLQNITADLTASAYTPNAGTLMSNYILAASATGTGHITPAPLYVTGITAANKVYDTNTNAALNVSQASLAGLVSGEAGLVTLNTSTSGAFSQADVGTGLAVTASGFSISGTGGSNYTLQPVTGLHANITPASLTISGVLANSKIYDASAVATLDTSGASLLGVLGSDPVTLATSGVSGTFSTVNVGTGLAVTAGGFSLGGAKASDYVLSQPGGLTANITPRAITANITGNPTKVYDGSTSATLTASDYTLTGFVGGQSATVPQSATANYVSPNAGSNIGLQSTLVISDFVAAAGTDLSNYIMPSAATGTLGTITPKVLNLSGTRVYDTTTNAAAGLFGTLSGLNGDVLTVSGTGTLASKNVGTQTFSSLGTLTLSATGGPLASNYTLVGGTDIVKITPASLTVAGTQAADKIYDGNTTATLSGSVLSGVLSGDTVTLANDATGTFADKNVGAGKSVSTAMTLSGADASNYLLAQPSGVTASITGKTISVTATGKNRAYDGTVLDAVTLSSSGVISGDAIGFTDSSATFADANVGTAKTVSVSGISATGASAGNYILSNSTATTTADITPKVLNLTGSRQYDANTDAAATLFGLNGVLNGVSGETLTLSGTGVLSSKNVNPAQAFSSLAGFSLAGNGSALASNYTLVGGTDWVKITPAPLTVTGTTAANKVYDGTAVAALSGATLAGLLGSDAVTLGNSTIGTFSNKNVGTGKSVSTAMTISGADSANYSLTQPIGLTANISQRSITVAATGRSKVYDASNNASVTLFSSGIAAGDAITFHDTSATFADANVGTGKTVSISGITASGADSANYLLSNSAATTTASITPKVLNLTGTRVYDGATDAAAGLFGTGGVLTGVNGEMLTLSGTGSLSSKNVNPAQSFSSVSGFALTGNGSALASNYTLVGGTDSVNITKRPITVTATGANKVYDGNTADPGATLASSGIISGDTVSFLDTSAGFSDKNVGTGKSVTVAGITAGGADASNYSFNTTATTNADITRRPITVTATGTNKVYDGTVADSVTLSSAGLLSGDAVSFSSSSAAFANSNAGMGKTLSISGISASGSDSGNYSFNSAAATIANITPKPIAVTASGSSKVYDGNVMDSVSLGSSGVLTGDTVTFSDTYATFADANVGTAKTVSVTGISASGISAGNYTLINTSTVTNADITPQVINLSGTRVYDGAVDAAAGLFGANGVLNGIAGQTLTLSGTGTLTSKNVSTAQTFSSTSGFTLTGNGTALAGNYTLTGGTDVVSITPALLTVVNAQAASKTYDGNTTASVTGAMLGGVLGTDTVSLGNYTSGSFADRNVGTGKAVSTSMTLSGADAGNYVLAQPRLAADITPKSIVVAAVGTNKTYDGKTGDRVNLSGVGVITGDNVAFSSSSANFNNANVGNDKAVTVTGIVAMGSDAGNYKLASNVATTTANITSAAGVQDTAGAFGYLELSPDSIATPYGVAPSESPGQLTGNRKLLRRPVERNVERRDFAPGLSLRVVDGGVRLPSDAQ